MFYKYARKIYKKLLNMHNMQKNEYKLKLSLLLFIQFLSVA